MAGRHDEYAATPLARAGGERMMRTAWLGVTMLLVLFAVQAILAIASFVTP
jgi:hypothetical protein